MQCVAFISPLQYIRLCVYTYMAKADMVVHRQSREHRCSGCEQGGQWESMPRQMPRKGVLNNMTCFA
eukprot:9727194-Karenia_brevis.AAC.1